MQALKQSDELGRKWVHDTSCVLCRRRAEMLVPHLMQQVADGVAHNEGCGSHRACYRA